MINEDFVKLELNKIPTDERKLEFLENILKKQSPDEDMKKKIHILMSQSYINKKWWLNASKSFEKAAEISKTFDEKMNLLIKCGIFLIKSGKYTDSEEVFKKVVALESKSKKEETRKKLNNLYFEQGSNLESSGQHRKAIEIYLRLLIFNLSNSEKDSLRENIARLYDKIGNPREANRIKSEIGREIRKEQKISSEERED